MGKYLKTLARFPLHKDPTPSSAETLAKQFPIPVYLGTSPDWILGLASWFWSKSLTLSMGATTVLEIPAETPPKMKSVANF